MAAAHRDPTPAAHASAPATAPSTTRSPVTPPGVRSAWGLALAAGLTFLGVYLVAVHTVLGQRLENRALLGAALQTPADRLGSLEQLSTISQLSFAFALLAVLGVASARLRAGLGLAAAAVMGLAAVASQVLKALLPRPELLDVASWMQRNTFPSGHATAATAIAVGAMLVAPLRIRWLVVPLAAGYAALVGHATQIAGWHRLSDAIGGVLLVLVVAGAGVGVLARLGFVQRTSLGRIHPRILAGLAVAGAAPLLIAATLLALPTAFPLLYAPENARRVFLHVAFDLVGIGLTVLAITGFARVLEPLDLGLGVSPARGDRRSGFATGRAPGVASMGRPAPGSDRPLVPADAPESDGRT